MSSLADRIKARAGRATSTPGLSYAGSSEGSESDSGDDQDDAAVDPSQLPADGPSDDGEIVDGSDSEVERRHGGRKRSAGGPSARRIRARPARERDEGGEGATLEAEEGADEDWEGDTEEEEEEEEEEGEDENLEYGLRVPGRLWRRLFVHQRTSLEWLWELHRQEVGGIIGDEMGLGKTLQARREMPARDTCAR